MNWETIYLTAFFVGFVLSALSYLAGSLHGGSFHLHGHAHGWAGVRGGASRFNLATAAAFLAWFGGTGYLLQRHSTLWVYLELLVSIISGLVGAVIVFWFLAKLAAHDQPLDPADYDMVGVLGRVTSPIRTKGTGEILFLQDGSRKAAPARSEDAATIPRDTEVIVTRYEKGVAYVRRWEELT